MMRRCELEFFYQEGSNFFYPEMWEPYRDHIPVEERNDFITAYHKRLVSDDEDVKLKAAIAWTTWEKVL
jgi:proline iminopeptidase